VVIHGRIVSVTTQYVAADSPVHVRLHIPASIVALGVCVDLVPIQRAFEAPVRTICTATDAFVVFAAVVPCTYHIRVRSQVAGGDVILWTERPVVITVTSGNQSMTRSLTAMLLVGSVGMAGFVFVVLPLYVLPLPFSG
jgi:hypothetical protein